ncbi:MAG: MFS transporter [Candidatus Promineifilaceae bacterium]|nr:MFS transporter [Candidatus Promineifilaceae bacterium]
MKSPRYRWFVVAVFFFFMLLHQADKLLIGPLTTPIMETFDINEAQMGTVFTGALIVGAFLYPIWGYLYDRFARSKLLALASFIWGSTTWLSAIAPTYPAFLASRASTGLDDSSYPGLFSLVADYFSPAVRGKVYGLLQLTTPLGYLLGMVLALMLQGTLGWRGVFYLTGALGILLAVVIFFGVREAPRGRSEPELAELSHIGRYHFDWQVAKNLFKKRSLLLLYLQGFFGVFPWNVIAYWFFRYLEVERGYESSAILVTMAAAIMVMSLGYLSGGSLGDLLFRRTRRGRAIVSTGGILLGAVFLAVALSVPVGNQLLFGLTLVMAAFFMPFSSPNVISSVFDITLPEVRSTSLAVQYFLESSGAALAPVLAGLIAASASLEVAILVICLSAWLISALLFALVAVVIPTDIETLRGQLRQRAAEQRGGVAAALEPTGATT